LGCSKGRGPCKSTTNKTLVRIYRGEKKKGGGVDFPREGEKKGAPPPGPHQDPTRPKKKEKAHDLGAGRGGGKKKNAPPAKAILRLPRAGGAWRASLRRKGKKKNPEKRKKKIDRTIPDRKKKRSKTGNRRKKKRERREPGRARGFSRIPEGGGKKKLYLGGGGGGGGKRESTDPTPIRRGR